MSCELTRHRIAIGVLSAVCRNAVLWSEQRLAEVVGLHTRTSCVRPVSLGGHGHAQGERERAARTGPTALRSGV